MQKILFVGGQYADKVARCAGKLLERLWYPLSERVEGSVRFYELVLFKHPDSGEVRHFYVESSLLPYAPEPCNFGSAEEFIIDHWDDDYNIKDIVISISIA